MDMFKLMIGMTKQLALPSYDWFLLIDPINHIQMLGKQASCFVWLEHTQYYIHIANMYHL